MQIKDIRARAFAMPSTSPAFPKAPFRFIEREFYNITCRTELEKLGAVVPDPFEVKDRSGKY